MRRERLKNESSTTLNGAIDATQTSITVTDGSVFPSEGDFRLRCESELILCTARSGNSLTVVRGVEGTTGASHTDTTTIKAVLSEDALQRYGAANVPWFEQAPPLRIFDTSGAPIGESSFTWVNQGSTTATDRDESIILKIPAVTGPNFRAKVLSAPATPYEVIGAFDMMTQVLPLGTHQPRCGILFRESSTGKIFFMGAVRADNEGTQIVVQRFFTATSFDDAPYSVLWNLPAGLVWYKIADDGTNLTFHFSPNGIDWNQVHSVARTSFMAGGPDQIGFGGNASSGTSIVWQMLHHFSAG